MRILLLAMFFFMMHTAMGGADIPESTKSDKLDITVRGMDNDPNNWLRAYVPNNDKAILIKLGFKINNVRAILVTDINAQNKKCGKNQLENILYLSFDPNLNLQNVSTRINKPCVVNNSALLKLSIATENDARYHNTIKLGVYPYPAAAE